MRTVAVVGASLAGVSAVGALRSSGFDGRVVLVGDEQHVPYDRPPLSKDFLAGTVDAAELALTAPDDDLGVEWRLGVRAGELDTAGAAVVLETGERLACDGVVLATGARARRWPAGVPAGVHTLRTLEDAVALRAELVPGARLVVIGGGFIGAEVASTARGLGLDVTVVEAAALPLGAALGEEVARLCTGLHAEAGTRLRCATPVDGFVGTDRVRAVRLGDGTEVPADVVVVGIGSTPNTEWLASSGLVSPGGVAAGEDGTTAIGAVVAAGDCTATNEHWAAAQQQPRAAVAALLGVPYKPPASARAPYFWSDQYGRRLQFAGHRDGTEHVEVVDGDPAAHDFAAVYRRDGDPVAVFAMDRTRTFTAWRRRLVAATRTEPSPAGSPHHPETGRPTCPTPRTPTPSPTSRSAGPPTATRSP